MSADKHYRTGKIKRRMLSNILFSIRRFKPKGKEFALL